MSQHNHGGIQHAPPSKRKDAEGDQKGEPTDGDGPLVTPKEADSRGTSSEVCKNEGRVWKLNQRGQGNVS